MCPWCLGCGTLFPKPGTSVGMCRTCWLSAKPPFCTFFKCKNPLDHTWETEGEGEKEKHKSRAEWDSGSVSVQQNRVVSRWNCCFATASVVAWQVPRSMLLENYCPSSAEEQTLEGPALGMLLAAAGAQSSLPDPQLLLIKPEKTLLCENPQGL